MDQAGIYHTGIAKGSHHKGPRAAGNKSLISFRAGHGVVGYVGYCPSWEAIPIPVKEGPSTRAGTASSKARAEPAWELDSGSVHRTTTYQASISAKAKRPQTAPAVPRGPRSPGAADEEPLARAAPKFIANSTYRVSYNTPKDDLRPMTAAQARRKPAFMMGSTYSSSYENSVELMYGPGWLDEQSQKKRTIKKYADAWQEVNVQRPPTKTTFQTDYGEFGEGIQGQLPAHHLGISAEGTTRHLFEGTAKEYRRTPGYSGFVPESRNNPHAIAQAIDDHEHPHPKECRLFTLNQYLKEIPGTQTFQPKDAANLMNPPKGRIGTASYFANAFMSNQENLDVLARKRASQKSYGTTQGTRDFFQPGTDMVSENGLKNAEAFYKLLRPFEGLPRVSRPSATSESGYRFGCYTEAA